MNNDRDTMLEKLTDDPSGFRPLVPPRLMLETSGCYATKDEENDAIHIFAQDGSELYALSSKIIPYESKPLYLTVQIYLMGHNNGRVTMQQEVKAKIEKLTELMKMCV